MDCNKIGSYIQVKRKAIGLTQAELGEKLGVTDKAVSKWECGVALPDISLFNELTNILQIEISELLNGEDKKAVPIYKKKNILILVLSIFLFFQLIINFFLGVFFIKNYGKFHIYNLSSERNLFHVDGNLIVVGDNSYLLISDVKYISDNEEYVFIYGLEYEVYYEEKLLYKEGDINFESDNNTNELLFVNELKNIDFLIKLPDNIKISNYFNLKINILDSHGKNKSFDITLNLKSLK